MNDNAAVNNVAENNAPAEHAAFNESTEELLRNMEEKPTELNDSSGKKGAVANSGSTNTTSNPAKSKKRKKIPRDATAPKQPLTGYFRFLNDRRVKVRSENPNISFSEITKVLAAEWSNLPSDQKQQYLDAAEQDKERYNKEFSDYKQTEAYRIFNEKQSEKQNSETNKKETNKTEKNGIDTNAEQNDVQEKEGDYSGFDIPIFTEEFLDHNKACESELRQLRKATSDYEAQNAVLQRHVDSLQSAVKRLETETNQQRASNHALQSHFDSMKNQLIGCFANIPLPGLNEGATAQNIDSYMETIETLFSSNANPSLRSALRNAVSRLDFSG